MKMNIKYTSLETAFCDTRLCENMLLFTMKDILRDSLTRSLNKKVCESFKKQFYFSNQYQLCGEHIIERNRPHQV